jgi:hypothetical protein
MKAALVYLRKAALTCSISSSTTIDIRFSIYINGNISFSQLAPLHKS